jgi:hypothetical protein
MRDGLCRPAKLSLGAQMEREEHNCMDDEYCHLHSWQLRSGEKASEKQAGDKAFFHEFVNFVQREDPKVLPMIEGLSATGTQVEAADWLGITEREFGRTRSRLSLLAECFVSGEPVPKQRRPYNKRGVKTSHSSG